MTRLPADDVLDALVDIFDPHRYQPDPNCEPGWRYDRVTRQRVFSSAWLDIGSVEAHSRPDELEVRRRQRELDGRTRSLGAGRRGA